GVVDARELAGETLRRDVSGSVVDGMPDFVRQDLGGVIGGQIVAKVDSQRLAGTAVYVRLTKVGSHLARRAIRRDSASERLCEGVKLRWREGLILSAHHCSTDHVVGGEGASFDVFEESSGGIGWGSGRIIGAERARRFCRWVIHQRQSAGERLSRACHAPRARSR